MKSEHRHELAENDLAKWIVRARAAVEPHTNKILIGVLAVTVIAVGTIMMVRASGTARQEGFTQLAACSTAEDFEKVADEYTDLPAGIWARLRAAQEHLQDGIEFSLSDRSASIERLEESRNAFEMVLDNRNAPTEAREKALYGLAMCLESLAGDDEGIGQAVTAYEALIADYPKTRYKKWADERIEVLGSDDAREFYKWFHAQNPKPEERPFPMDTPDPFAGINLPAENAVAGEGDLPPPPPSVEQVNPTPTPPESGGPALPGPPDEESEDASEPEESSTPDSEDDETEKPEGETPEEADAVPKDEVPPSE